MNINYLRNLLFQKKRFESIFKSYSIIEPANVHANLSSIIGNRYLYIMTAQDEDIARMISEMFAVDIGKQTDICILKHGFEERISIEEERVLQIEANHPYLNKWFSVCIAKYVDESLLFRSFDFYTYKLENFELFQKLRARKITGNDAKLHDLGNVDAIKDLIGRYETKYRLKFEIEAPERLPHLEDIRVTERASLEIIRILNDNWQRTTGELLKLCGEKTINIFSLRAEEILGYFLYDGEFYKNFVRVEIYFSFMNRARKNVIEYLDQEIAPSLEWMKSNIKGRVALYNTLSDDKRIVEIDDYLEKKLNELFTKLEDVE